MKGLMKIIGAILGMLGLSSLASGKKKAAVKKIDTKKKALKKAKIYAEYEGMTFTLQEAFSFTVDSYERQANGKGDMVNRGQKKIQSIKYTPDFISPSFIIECKGRANESFPLRWKMFKKHVKVNLPHVTLYKPQNQKECDKVIELITKNK